MYRVTFTKDPELVGNLKKRGAWPFPFGGVEWTESTSIETDDLMPFLADPRLGAESPVSPLLVVEEMPATPKKAKKEDAHGEPAES